MDDDIKKNTELAHRKVNYQHINESTPPKNGIIDSRMGK